MAQPEYHPWREIRSRTQVDVQWCDLRPGVDGETDGAVSIRLSRRLGQIGRRSTATHETVHIDWGHGCGQSEAIERLVRIETARRLIPLSLLGSALAYSLDLHEVAFDIWVSRSVLDDRLAALNDREVAYLRRFTEHHRN